VCRIIESADHGALSTSSYVQIGPRIPVYDGADAREQQREYNSRQHTTFRCKIRGLPVAQPFDKQNVMNCKEHHLPELELATGQAREALQAILYTILL